MTSQKPKKFISILVVLTMILTLLPATLGLAAYATLDEFVTNVYEAVYERIPDEEGYNWWVEQLSTKQQTACQFIGYVLLDAPEFKEKFADITEEEFVEKLYNVLFNRDSDAEGLEYWIDQLEAGYSRKFVIYAMMQDITNAEFLTFCNTVGIAVGTLDLTVEDYPPAEPDKLEVVDVSAINLKQILVEFNSANLINEEVEDKDNYSLENEKGKAFKGQGNANVDIIDVEIDGNEAILTLDVAAENQTEATLVIKKAVLGAEYKEEVLFKDLTVPTVEDAEVVGENTVKVVFSEPIVDSTVNIKEFEVESADGKTDYRVKGVKLQKNGTEALVEVRTDFEDGDEVVLTVNNGLKDYAGFRVPKTTIDLTVVEDNREIAIVGYRKATEEGITLIFNKNIILEDDDEDNFYHTNSRNTADSVTVDGNELELVFTTNELPKGVANIYIDGDTLGDYWGNTNEKTIHYEVVVSPDTVAPTIKKVTVVSNRTLTVDFDKRLDEDTAEDEDNYTIVYESNGKEVKDTEIYRVSLKDNDTVEIRLSGDALEPGKYVLIVNGVEDTRGNAIKDGKKSFKVEGNPLAAADITVTGYEDGDSSYVNDKRDVEYTILVDYGRKMDVTDERYSIALLENYSVMIDGKLVTLEDLADKDNYYVDLEVDEDEEVAEITIEVEDEKSANRITSITISRIMDATGLLSANASYTKTIDFSVSSARDIQIVSGSVKAIALDKIEVKFNQKIDYFEEDDFALEIQKVDSNGNVISDQWQDWDEIDDIDLASDGKKITIYLDEDLDYTGKFEGRSIRIKENTSADSGTKYGGELVIPAAIVVADGIAPEFDVDFEDSNFEDGYYVHKEDGKLVIDLKFTEELADIDPADEDKVKGSFTLSDIKMADYSISVVDDDTLRFTITSNFTKEKTTIKLATTNEYLTDDSSNKNKVKAFEVTVYGVDEIAATTDANIVAKAKANLAIGFADGDSANSVTGNLTLPTSQDGASVSWASNNDAVITADGSVTRPEAGQPDAVVTLTATITKGGASDTKAFNLTVKANE